jgi:Glyoxalase/Bleomycin resistance protein/Dioxygenase superfamily
MKSLKRWEPSGMKSFAKRLCSGGSGSNENTKDSDVQEEEYVHVPKQDLYKVGTFAAAQQQQQDGTGSSSSPVVVAVGYGKYYPEFWVGLPHDKGEASAGNGTHIAFQCSSKSLVDQVYKVAMAKGCKCNGPPGPRAEYSDKYYGAFFIDHRGNKMEATFWDMGIFNYCSIL